MCVFEISEIANLALNIVGTVEKVQEIQTTKAENKHKQQEFLKQAKKAENEAATERQEGIEEARRQKLSAILNVEREKANIASGNIEVDSQTALNVYSGHTLNGELNALNTMNKAEKRASNYIEKANKYYQQAELSAQKSKNAFKNSIISQYKNFDFGKMIDSY